MTTETAVAVNDADLRALAGLARPEDSDDMPKIPVLKINYDPESIHSRGDWVVGQQKDQDGVITEQGQKVKALVILAVRRRYSFYNNADTEQNCSSQIFTATQTVFGSKYGYNCKSGECPKRAKEANPRCKAQHIVFAMAITDENKMVECISYVQGTGYMPFDEYKRGLTRVKTATGFVDVPPFAFVTILGSTKERNAGTTYFKPVFTKGPMFKMEQVQMFAEKRDAVNDVIEALNSKVQKTSDAPVSGPSAPPAASAPAAAPAATTAPGTTPAAGRFKVDDDPTGAIDVDAITKSMTTTPIPEAPTTVAEAVAPAAAPAAEPSGVSADFDIEATIAAALAD